MTTRFQIRRKIGVDRIGYFWKGKLTGGKRLWIVREPG